MYNDNLAIESFIAYCDDMMISEEGLIKNFINKRKEKKRIKKEKYENEKKAFKTRALILKYVKKYIYPECNKILDTMSKFIEGECKKKGIGTQIKHNHSIYYDEERGCIECFITIENDTLGICDEIVEKSFDYIKNKYPEFYNMIEFNDEYGPDMYRIAIYSDSSAEKYLEKFSDFKKEKEELDKKYTDIL